MPAGQERKLKLRSHAICRRDQYRLFVALEKKPAPETPDIRENILRKCPPSHAPDGRNRAIGLVDVDSCVLVSHKCWQYSTFAHASIRDDKDAADNRGSVHAVRSLQAPLFSVSRARPRNPRPAHRQATS